MNERMSEWMSEWVNEWTSEWMCEPMMTKWSSEWINDRVNDQVDEGTWEWIKNDQVNVIMNDWMDDQVNEWRNDRLNECANGQMCERRRICSNGFELKLLIHPIAQVYSITTGGWYTPEVTGKKPPARSGHSAALLHDKMLIFGGWDMPAVFNDVHVFDLTFAEWTTPDNIQVDRYYRKSH